MCASINFSQDPKMSCGMFLFVCFIKASSIWKLLLINKGEVKAVARIRAVQKLIEENLNKMKELDSNLQENELCDSLKQQVDLKMKKLLIQLMTFITFMKINLINEWTLQKNHLKLLLQLLKQYLFCVASTSMHIIYIYVVL